jgi:hypothetical protein
VIQRRPCETAYDGSVAGPSGGFVSVPCRPRIGVLTPERDLL